MNLQLCIALNARLFAQDSDSLILLFFLQDVTKLLHKCREEGAIRLDLSKHQVLNTL